MSGGPVIDYFTVTSTGLQRTVNHIFYEPVTGSIFASVKSDSAVVELRASDGAYRNADLTAGSTVADATISIGANPYAVWANQTHVFVCTSGSPNAIRKFSRATRTEVGSITGNSWPGSMSFINGGPGYNQQMVYLGGYLWVACGNAAAYTGLLRVDPSDMSYTFFSVTCTVAGSNGSRQVATDGTYLYVVSGSADTGYVRVVDQTGTTLGSYQPSGGTTQLWGPTVGGGYLYLTNPATNPANVYQIQLSDMTQVASLTMVSQALSGSTVGAYYDGSSLWLASGTATIPSFCRVRADLAAPVDAGLVQGACYGFAFDGVYLWGCRSLAVPSQVFRFRTESTPTNITIAKADATGVQLGFDASVTVSPSVDIGSAVGYLQVTGVTSTSDTLKELSISVTHPPWIEPPDGAAEYNDFLPPTAEADMVGPPVPTGAGAKVI